MVMAALPRITDFEILEKLGEGSYATVYRARHKKTKSCHAIKFVEMSSLSDSSRENLITEIRLLRSLNHKYIVTLQDFFWDDKNIYIVLEYCNAGSLHSFIRSKKSLPEATCKYFLRQLAAAVQYMRNNEISHFDLKPQNLLLTKLNNSNVSLKVADFGFAQHLKLGEINQQLKGSPLYMAPEIIRKQRYDARADLWSIGVILYECLFGRAPYSSRTIEELLSRIQNCEKITLPPNARISKECEDLLSRLLQHDPGKRIAFNDFFNHAFLDLKTVPSEKTLQKAIDLVTQAVEYDEKQNYKEAYYLYCSSLQYFVPLITDETDANKRMALRQRAQTYLKRAEEIKNVIIEEEYKALALRTQAKNSQEALPSTTTTSNNVQQALEPETRYKQLYSLSHSSPSLKTGLDIGRQGELYLFERKYESALESFTAALGILVPFLNKEPKGDRRSLLLQQLDLWMKEAESIKSLLNAKEIEDDHKLSHSVYHHRHRCETFLCSMMNILSLFSNNFLSFFIYGMFKLLQNILFYVILKK
ncbi:unc-51 like kinase 3 homolog Aduk [Haematobia irritans]|uniref:unc-51 like kinase 3 homolog Aduk n=1 Tax=Haematobia irritans TaxID=7368 RepID=UPI003F4FC9B9